MCALRNNKGMSVIETLVGLSLLSIVIVVSLYSRDFFIKSSDRVSTLNTTDNRVFEIIQSLNANITQQVVSFPDEPDAFIQEKLSRNKLPMAWSINTDVPLNECVNCPGRYGYVITPLPGYQGIFLVTVRFTHTEWGTETAPVEQGGGLIPGEKTFQFLVTR